MLLISHPRKPIKLHSSPNETGQGTEEKRLGWGKGDQLANTITICPPSEGCKEPLVIEIKLHD
jgi:hypothetical protein